MATKSFIVKNGLQVGGSISATGNLVIEGTITGDGSGLSGVTSYTISNFDSDFGSKSTSDLAEGSNQYFTATRARNAMVAGSGIVYDSASGVISTAGGAAVDLFDSADFTIAFAAESTTNLPEGDNLYYTDVRVATKIDSYVTGGTGVTVTSGTIAIASSGVVAGTYGSATQIPVLTVNAQGQIDSASIVSFDLFDSADFTIAFAAESTTNLPEGTNLYYTAARGDSAARSALVAVDAGGDGSFGYDSATGIFTYTGPSAAEVRAHTVAGTGIIYDSSSGVISIGQAVGVSDNVTFGDISASNFTITGTTTTVNATTLAVEDPLIQLAKANNSTDVVDIGFIGRYYAGGDVKRTGLFRDASDGNFYLFKDMIDSTHDSAIPPTTINRGATGFVASTLVANVTGALTGNADTATTAAALTTGRTIAMSGDITATGVSFDGTSGITLTSAITAGSIINADINASAAIVDTKLATIATAGKVSNSATTAASANTGSAIVARDASGDFSAGTITATSFAGSGASLTGLPAGYTITNFDSDFGDKTTNNLTEGNANLYHTTARARGSISVTDVSGDGSLSYDNGTGIITYTGPSATEVRAKMVAGTGVTYDSAAGRISITNTAVTAATYGDATNIPQIAVNDQGQITGVTNISVAPGYTITNFDSDFGSQTTDNLTEGTNLYFTAARGAGAISVTDAGGDGSLSYNGGTGVITYTGPSASEVRAHITASTGISISSGAVSNTGVLTVNGVAGAVTAANLMTAIQTVDGATSALDADLLDGEHGAYYRINVYNNAGTLLN
jgi:hypothetical protein